MMSIRRCVLPMYEKLVYVGILLSVERVDFFANHTS